MQSDSRVDILPLRLNDYEKIVFFTGAGMSEESGIPTYRGKGGTWKQYNLSLIHISEPTRQAEMSYAVFCL